MLLLNKVPAWLALDLYGSLQDLLELLLRKLQRLAFLIFPSLRPFNRFVITAITPPLYQLLICRTLFTSATCNLDHLRYIRPEVAFTTWDLSRRRSMWDFGRHSWLL